MSHFIDCPECNHKILSRLGTICPNCGFTIGYFNGNSKRKEYGKLFALSVFTPFISLVTTLFAQINIYTLIIGIILYFYLAFKSCPLRFKHVFFSKFEKLLFWGIWLIANGVLVVTIINILSKKI